MVLLGGRSRLTAELRSLPEETFRLAEEVDCCLSKGSGWCFVKRSEESSRFSEILE